MIEYIKLFYAFFFGCLLTCCAFSIQTDSFNKEVDSLHDDKTVIVIGWRDTDTTAINSMLKTGKKHAYVLYRKEDYESAKNKILDDIEEILEKLEYSPRKGEK